MKKPKIPTLSSRDRAQASLLVNAGILKPFDSALLTRHPQLQKGFVFVGCSDGSVSRIIQNQCHRICREIGATPCVHCFQAGGGGLLIPPSTPIIIPGLDSAGISAFCRKQISIGILVKELQAVMLSAHAPCAAAAEAGLDLIGTIELLMAAKVDIRNQYPRNSGDHVVIVPAILLQFSQRDTRLFFIHIESWRRHLATLAEWRETAAPRKRRLAKPQAQHAAH